MVICEHCREAVASRGERFSEQPLDESSLTRAREDEDGLMWLTCEWCRDEDTVDGMAEVAFVH